MAELVAGALLSASLQVLFERLASEEILQLFQGKKVILDLLYELKAKLLSANSLLNDAEEKQFENERVREWLFMLQDVIYKADDLLDRIDYETLRSNLKAGESGSCVSKVFMKLTPSVFSAFDKTVKRDATEILRRLKILIDEKGALGLREGVQSKPSQRPSAPLVEESDVYGRDGDKEAIVALLLSDDVSGNKISVIPIVGMGGIGKTTLALLVYKDNRVEKHFEFKVWVTVSDEFDVFKLTKIIFERITSKSCDIKDLFELQMRLKEALSGKKFLFVLDDLWNENYSLWDDLRSSFQSGADGSKIIVTTRSERVASMMATGTNHHLTDLSEDECWNLFTKHAFRNNVDLSAYQDLQVIGREIVKKCKGLPLAIKSIGGLLRSELDLKKWEDILHSDAWELHKKEDTILPALWLSYRHLPAHLKRCFAYCSIFPKDYRFEREKLILLWMAEGFLQFDKKNKRMEELGEEYLHELLSRSLFQQSTRLNESTIHMHDLVHDLAMFVSGEFCFRLDLSNDLDNLSSNTRHLSYERGTYDTNNLRGLYKAKYLRTFVALPLGLPPGDVFPGHLVPYSMLLRDGRCLRVLSLSQSSIENLPDSISNLKHLRYLDLSCTGIRELPDSICTLYNLQTLLLSDCVFLSQLPKKMGRLINLRHLDIDDVFLKKMPLQISNMKNLQTLPQVILGDGQSGPRIKELKVLEHLHGTLDISGLEYIVDAAEASEANLKDKKCLKKIKLRWNAHAGVADSSLKEKELLEALLPHTNLTELTIENYRGTLFSNWVGDNSFSNLVEIQLTNCKNCRFLPPLGQLASLKNLKIYGLDSLVSVGDEIRGNGPSPPFSCLRYLWISNMSGWKEWSFSEAAIQEEGGIFPRLIDLGLNECPKLNVGLPGHLPSLEYLTIDNCEEMGVLLPRTQQIITSPSLLVSIQVQNCPKLESLLDWGLHSKVKRLCLLTCKTLLENRMHWDLQRLSHLEDLNISEWEEDSFPDEVLHLPTSLCQIIIQNSTKLEALNGTAFRRLTSLQSLLINNCKSLRCLPDEGLPTSLSHLSIRGCDLLNKRCEEGGEDRPKIANIAFVTVDPEHFGGTIISASRGPRAAD